MKQQNILNEHAIKKKGQSVRQQITLLRVHPNPLTCKLLAITRELARPTTVNHIARKNIEKLTFPNCLHKTANAFGSL